MDHLSDRQAQAPGSSDENRLRAGDFFLLTIWIQGQMGDLLTFASLPHLVEPFTANASEIPKRFVDERFRRQAHSFTQVRNQFVEAFGELLLPPDIADLDYLAFVRNAVAHSHISLAREYFLYRPTGGERREAELLRASQLQPAADSAEPRVFKLTFDQKRYESDLDRIARLDERCLARVAQHVGVEHSRIR